MLALRSLWLHKMRAILSVLGIIIGTAAVISLMAFGEGSMQDALEDIKRLGATNIIVRSVKPPDEISTQTRTFVARYGITQEDYDLFATIPTVIRMVPMRIFPKPVYHDQYMWNSRIVATTPEYKDVNKLQVAAGRFLVDDDSQEHARTYCVLGSNVAAKLFPFEQPHRRDDPDRQVQLRGGRRRGRADADRRQRRQPGRRGLQQRRLHPHRHRRGPLRQDGLPAPVRHAQRRAGRVQPGDADRRRHRRGAPGRRGDQDDPGSPPARRTPR